MHWASDLVTFDAEEGWIDAGGRRFVGSGAAPAIRSDVASDGYRTLEVSWTEHAVEMRMFVYFRADATHWWADEIRTYNGNPTGDWITYRGTFFKARHGESFRGDLDVAIDPADATRGALHLRNVTVGLKPVPALRQNEPGPVHVLSPLNGSTVIPGQSLALDVVVDVPYQVDALEVELWDIASDMRHTWTLDQALPAHARSRLQQVIPVPATLPHGADYRLSITARPADTTQGSAVGYSVPVHVARGPSAP